MSADCRGGWGGLQLEIATGVLELCWSARLQGRAMSVPRIAPNIRSAAPAKARSFYEDVLGLKTAMHMGWIITVASPSNSTAQVSVVHSDERPEPHAEVSVEVADADAWYAAAEQRGLEISAWSPPSSGTDGSRTVDAVL